MQTRTYLNLVRGMTLIFGAAVLVSVLASTPSRIGPLGVTLWFVALLINLQGVLTLVLYQLKRGMELEMGSSARFMSAYRQGFLLSTGAVACLALSSLRQLSLRDVILIVILGALIEFYLRTRRS